MGHPGYLKHCEYRSGNRDPSTPQVGSLRSPACCAQDDNSPYVSQWARGPADLNQSTTSVTTRNEILRLRGRFQRALRPLFLRQKQQAVLNNSIPFYRTLWEFLTPPGFSPGFQIALSRQLFSR